MAKAGRPRNASRTVAVPPAAVAQLPRRAPRGSPCEGTRASEGEVADSSPTASRSHLVEVSATPRRNASADPMTVSLEQARAAKAAAAKVFRQIADVVGVGITRVRGDYAVKVNLREAPAAGIELPSTVDGVQVRVEITGSVMPRTI